MNWRRLYAMLQIWIMVGLTSFAAAGCNTVVVIGICRKLLGWSDGVSVFGIGFPVFVIQFIVFAKYLPKPLRKAGRLSDDPEKFGPWFK
ncbi:hypothetical protein [Mycetohabitans sp. B46]|uniref:hypothetical protein n=1 Tax=Mycetohabitans sp. B46 TaxID=2772536 RepID=UPI00307F71F3